MWKRFGSSGPSRGMHFVLNFQKERIMNSWLKTQLMHVILFLIIIVFSTTGARAQEKDPAMLSASVINQINALAAEKASRTPAQRKMSSQFIIALKQRYDDPLLRGLPMLKAAVEIEPDDTTIVDIKASVSPSLLSEIERLGGTIINSFVEYDAIRARLPLDIIETLAADPDIRFIRPADKAMLNKVNTSEGDKAHNAPAARSTYHVNGSGVKVGVLSDSVDHLASVQATGDLPGVTVLQNAPGNTGEGTAMLEIVHDLAPGAQLYFATAWLGPASFANNIIALANAGCKVIVDDVGYFAESPFQDDVISQAVNTVTSNGVLYFSSAGNSGNKNDGQSGVWEGDYNSTASIITGYSSVHDFGGGDRLNRITMRSSAFTLFWSDPLGGSSNDYDFFIIDPAGTSIVLSSIDVQNGNDDPYESIFLVSGDPTNFQIVIAKWSGEDRFINFSTNRGRLERNTAGQIRGHSAAENGFGVAAVEARGMTTPFNGSEPVETFSTDGPRRVFFNPNGSAITPGNFSSTGGKVRMKPDIAAADGVMTATPGFNPFYGTSAAAPHAAALGALMVSKKPSITLSEVRDIFERTALDIEAAGWDRDSGWGIIMAVLVLNEILSGINPAILFLLL